MPIIKSPPPAPLQWRRTPTNIEMDWHHIIPGSVLRDVWNSLVVQCQRSQEQQAWRALYQHLRLCDSGLAGIDNSIQQLRSGTLSEGQKTVLRRIAYWPAWDIVEGPRSRTDNPNNLLDRFTVGLTSQEQERMRWAERLYREFGAFLAARSITEATLRNLATTLSMARQSLACVHPIPFRQEMWEQAGDGAWRKRRSAAAAQ